MSFSRYRNRQAKQLAGRAMSKRSALIASLQAQLVDAEVEMVGAQEELADAEQRRAALLTGVHAQIDEYIDSLAQMVDADDKQTSFGFQSDGALHEQLVRYGWHGVTTIEQAKQELSQVVARRSVGKTDLAVLLSSVDHTAVNLFGTMPEHLMDLHGPALVEAVVETLAREDFASQLTQDQNWARMRGRWVRLGWRGADDSNFNDAFVRAAAERVAAIRDSVGKGVVESGLGITMLDTVIDEQLKKANPQLREQMVQAFQSRLEREYEQLPKQAGPGYGAVLDEPRGDLEVAVLSARRFGGGAAGGETQSATDKPKYPFDLTLDGEDVKRLDVVAKRWGMTRNGAMEKIIQEAAQKHLPLGTVMPPGAVSIDQLRTEANAILDRTISGVDPKDREETLRVWRDQLKQRMAECSDHDMMRVGRGVWETSYSLGWSDEQVRDELAHFGTDFIWPDHLILFTAKWAVHAFQRLMTSHTFAAALMCSDVQKDVLDGIEKQWDAFLVIVPNGMLIADQFEFSRILVATYSFGARLILLTTGGPMLRLPSARTVTDEAPTIADLLVSEESNLIAETPTQRCLVMAKRLVAGLLLNLQHEPNFKVKKVEARPKSKGRVAEPEHRIVTVGKPLEIDCRAAVKEYVEHGKSGRKHAPPTVQVMVRGHFRRQVCGVGRMERKVIWIEPFWRGPEAALIQTRPTKATP